MGTYHRHQNTQVILLMLQAGQGLDEFHLNPRTSLVKILPSLGVSKKTRIGTILEFAHNRAWYSLHNIWMFPKIGVGPQTIHFNKPSILGGLPTLFLVQHPSHHKWSNLNHFWRKIRIKDAKKEIGPGILVRKNLSTWRGKPLVYLKLVKKIRICPG